MAPPAKKDPFSYSITVTVRQSLGEKLDRVLPPASEKRRTINLTDALRGPVEDTLLEIILQQEKKDAATARAATTARLTGVLVPKGGGAPPKKGRKGKKEKPLFSAPRMPEGWK